jgi:hypothetical protein
MPKDDIRKSGTMSAAFMLVYTNIAFKIMEHKDENVINIVTNML